MKRLTKQQVHELKNGMGDPNREDDWDEKVVQELVDAGYLDYWQDEEWEYVTTTPKGALALRCYEALLRTQPN